MASNFRVSRKESRNRLMALKLFGDFDGSSACELINILDQAILGQRKVAIDTDGLRTIHAFGLDVFLPRIARMRNIWTEIEVTGRFSQIFNET